jgi:hypothetical protein
MITINHPKGMANMTYHIATSLNAHTLINKNNNARDVVHALMDEKVFEIVYVDFGVSSKNGGDGGVWEMLIEELNDEYEWENDTNITFFSYDLDKTMRITFLASSERTIVFAVNTDNEMHDLDHIVMINKLE